MSVRDRLRRWWELFAAEAGKFGVIGVIGIVVDNGAFLLLTHGIEGPGPLAGHEKIASIVATAIATVFSWVCNRYWTFRDRRALDVRRELVLFTVFNAIGALITAACVAVAIDLAHVTGPFGQTVARLVGIALGTLFRFWAYRRFVFVSELADLPDGSEPEPGPRLRGGAGTTGGDTTSPRARDAERVTEAGSTSRPARD